MSSKAKWTNYLLSFRVYAFQLADFSAEKWISQNVSSADVCGRLQKASADTEIFFSVNLSICAKPQKFLLPLPQTLLCLQDRHRQSPTPHPTTRLWMLSFLPMHLPGTAVVIRGTNERPSTSLSDVVDITFILDGEQVQPI